MRAKKSRSARLRMTGLLVVFLSGMFANGLFIPLRSASVYADSTPQNLPFSQNWSNTGLITTDDNWAGVPGIVGFRGDDLTTVTATDPQTILADGSGTPVDVIANQANPNTQATGGVAEFDGIANPVVALQGSGTADAPHLVISVNTTGLSGIKVAYILRDIDGSADNAVQPVALQFRVGSTGNYTNIPAGFVADATTGPSLATLMTPVSVTLPAAAENQPLVQIRIITTNAVGNDEWVGIEDLLIFVPTTARVEAFAAQGDDDGNVLLDWRTGFEVNNLGFNIYRETQGKRTRINADLLAGSALMVGAGTRLMAGRAYSWSDTLPKNTAAAYWLEEIDLSGESRWHGPVAIDRAGLQGKTARPASRAKLLSRLGSRLEQATFSSPMARVAMPPAVTAEPVTAQAELSARPAIKLLVKEEGWYRVTAQELFAAGLDRATDPRLLQLFAEGQEQAFTVQGAADGRLDDADAIEFYGLGLDTPTTNARAYKLIAGTQPGLRIAPAKKKGTHPAASGFTQTVERKDRAIYFSSLTNGEKENFFGAVIAQNPLDQTLALGHIDHAATEPATLEVALQGVNVYAHRVGVQLNGTELGEINGFAATQTGAAKFTVPQALLKDGPNTVTLTNRSGAGDVSLVDFLRLTYAHAYRADNDTLRFTLGKKQRVSVDGFTNSRIRVVDVTDPNLPGAVSGLVEFRGNDYTITISGQKTSERTLLAFAEAQMKRPAAVIFDQPSNLQDKSTTADYLIITRKEFFNAVEGLKQHRRNQGLEVAVVDIEDIYDEFNFGEKSPQAIKDFLAFAKTNWAKAPRYVLLVGDASLDAKNYFGGGEASDLVPTKLVDTFLMEAASDEWLADFDGDGLAELALGRLPAQSVDEAARLASKVMAYDNVITSGVLLVSDSNDGIDFENGSAQLRSVIPAEMNIEELVRGRADDVATKGEVLARINNGQKLVNYYGHGTVDGWRGNILSNDATAAFTNQSLSTFIFMTCLTGYFNDPFLESLAESSLKAQGGGAGAVWASSGQCSAGEQIPAAQELYRALFEGDSFGDAIKRAKSSISDRDVRLTWILFGDPASRLRR